MIPPIITPDVGAVIEIIEYMNETSDSFEFN